MCLYVKSINLNYIWFGESNHPTPPDVDVDIVYFESKEFSLTLKSIYKIKWNLCHELC